MRNLGGPFNNKGSWVHLTSDGGYIVVGSMNFGANLKHDVWLIKTDAEGHFEW